MSSPSSQVPSVARSIARAKLCWAAAWLHIALAGCQAFGGRPGGDGPVVVADAGGPCLGTCEPDPGWRPVDCKPASGIETLSIVSFNEATSMIADSSAANLYAYTDGTAGRLLFAYVSPKTGNLAYADAGFQPPTLVLPAGSIVPGDAGLCAPRNSVLHVLGGPFLGWGGGMGVSMQKLNDRTLDNPASTGDANRALCNKDLGHYTPAVCPPEDAEYAVRVGALDVSQYEGVSFWARRGPNSQIGLRVNVGDKHTDDDLSYFAYSHSVKVGRPLCGPGVTSADCEPIYCQRVKECACRTHLACTHYDVPPVGGDMPGYYCGSTPAQVLQNVSTDTGSQGGGSDDNRFCDVTACDRPYSAFPNDLEDKQFVGRPCTPYQWSNGVGSSYCFNPDKDPPPAGDTELCGDHWMTTVDLSTEWQFYRVPFTDLRQQGFGKRSPILDLHAVSLVRFTWDAGNVDYWLDDVSFYRMVH